jgi:hypothetical protein
MTCGGRIVAAILIGKQPAELTANKLADARLPLDWREQRNALGFASAQSRSPAASAPNEASNLLAEIRALPNRHDKTSTVNADSFVITLRRLTA